MPCFRLLSHFGVTHLRGRALHARVHTAIARPRAAAEGRVRQSGAGVRRRGGGRRRRWPARPTAATSRSQSHTVARQATVWGRWQILTAVYYTGAIIGSQKCRFVGKSQSVLITINPMISTRTRSNRGVLTLSVVLRRRPAPAAPVVPCACRPPGETAPTAAQDEPRA